MTDAEIEAYGKNVGEAFENAGKAVESLMVELESVKSIQSRKITLDGHDLGSLLYQWIESLIAFQEEEDLLFSSFRCRISENSSGSYSLTAEMHGEKFDPERHEQKTAIKAPTFHDMKISVKPERVTMRFLVDL